MIQIRYADEPSKTQAHIIVYALLEVIIGELFGKEHIKEYVTPESKDYQRAWQIVKEEGAQKLVEEFRTYS